MFSRIAFPWCFGAQKDQVTKRFGAEMINQWRRKRRNPNIKTSREE
jgi:bisphosphoglycerate-dependent phosphoglycerate mutase